MLSVGVFTVLDDEHRVQLKPLPDHRDCQGDYVNASYVDVSLTHSLNTSIIFSLFFISIIGTFNTQQVSCNPRFIIIHSFTT